MKRPIATLSLLLCFVALVHAQGSGAGPGAAPVPPAKAEGTPFGITMDEFVAIQKAARAGSVACPEVAALNREIAALTARRDAALTDYLVLKHPDLAVAIRTFNAKREEQKQLARAKEGGAGPASDRP